MLHYKHLHIFVGAMNCDEKNSHQDDGDKIVEFWPFNSLFGGKSSKYSIMSANEAPRRDKFSG